jgi:surface protein
MIIYDINNKTLVVPNGLGNLNNGSYDDGYNVGYENGVIVGGLDAVEDYIDALPTLEITENGSYDTINKGVVVNVPDTNGSYDEGYADGKTEGVDEYIAELPTLTITENGVYDTINKGVTVNVPDLNGDYDEGYTEGYNVGKVDGVDEYVAELPTLEITSNGSYDTPNKGVNVNVRQVNYSNFDGSVDINGLKAIGWDDESIGMFRDNAPHYAWEDDMYVVSDENKAVYGVVNSSNISNYKDDPNMVFVPYFDTSNVTNMERMFMEYSKIKSIPLFDTSNVTNMNRMFSGCYSLKNVPQINTSKVTDMDNMFNSCRSLTSVPQIDTSNVTDMSYMFNSCYPLTSVPQINTSNVTNMNSMFNNCYSLTSVPQIDTSNVTDMNNMFNSCYSLTSVSLSNTRNVTNMSYMFTSCNSLNNVSLNDTSSVTNMERMFNNCEKLTSLSLFDTSNVTNMGRIFGSYTLTNLTDVGGWVNLKCSWNDNYGLTKCPNLSYQSCINILNGLYDFVGNNVTPNSSQAQLKVHANFLTTVGDEISIGTNKGWTITA